MKKLIQKLQLIGKIFSHRWYIVQLIVKEIQNNNVNIISKRWEYSWKKDNEKYYPLDLSEIKTWSTFDNKCIDIMFFVENKKLTADITIFDGFPKTKRFSCKLQFKNNFVLNLKDIIDNRFDYYCEDQYEKYLAQEKQDWILNFRKTLNLD